MQFRTSARLLIALSASLLVAAPANAQTNPGSLERTVPKFEITPPETRPSVASPALPSQAAARIEQTFVLSAVHIEGATVFPSDELAKSFEPYLASLVGQAELEKIAAHITEKYRQAGFLLSYAVVPQQSVRSGIVRIRVVEGFISKVRLAGDKRAATAVSRILERLPKDRPLHSETLERVIGLARLVPGVIVKDVQISRLAPDPARHQLTIAIGAARYGALAYTDNRGTIENARIRGYTSFNLASLAIPGDQLQIDLFTIPYSKFRYAYGQVKGSIPLNSDGLRVSGSASYGDQAHGLAGTDQDGFSRQLTGELSYPFDTSRSFSLIGHAGLTDWKSEDKRSGLIVLRDRLQVARARLEFTKVSTIRLDGMIGISRGVDFGSATEKGDPLASRPFGSSKFTKFNAALQLTARLSDRARVRLETSAQYSTRPLLALEEYALGGSRIGRAFDFNELTGDHGAGAMLEISYRLREPKHGPKAVEIFTFVDGGGAFRHRSSAGLPKSQWLADVGAGARFAAFGFRWSGELGVPIARTGADRDVRAFFSVIKIF